MAQAQGFTAEQEESRTVPGFYGHPLLNWTENGYTAEPGAFFLGVAGNGKLQNLDHMTDSDPNNFAQTINLLDLTVALDQIVRIKPNKGNNLVYESGKKVGFLMSSSGDEFDVLDLDVVKLFCIYFYKGDELVATANGQNGDLDVLTLDVAGFNLTENKTRRTQKITAVCPKDKDGNIVKFDGIAIGTGGVNAKLIADIAINYAFLDDLEEVPIIKKYYPNVRANGKGMQTGAQNLINNKLNDGATTAVLNIGGAYYTVINDEPFPAGVEAGFRITTGSALQLDLGKAVQITALTYPKNADGTYNKTAEPIEVDITTQVNIIGLELAGGGKSAVTLMTNTKEPFFGLRLKMIKGVEVDLGATVVHYAYVKLPKMPETVYPFEITMDVVPDCNYNTAHDAFVNGYNGQNDYTDELYFSTVESAPIYTIESRTNNFWRTEYNGAVVGNIDYISMPVVRKKITADKVTDEVTFTDNPNIIGYIHLIHYNGEHMYSETKGYYFHFSSKDEKPSTATWTPSQWTKLEPDENGIIRFQGSKEGFHITESDHLDTFKYKSEETPNDFAAAFDYALFISAKGDEIKDIDNAYQLSYDRVRIPARTPDFEIAGKYALDFIKEKDANSASADLVTGCDNYLMLRVPDKFDWKTKTSGFDIYEHTGTNKADKKYSFKRSVDDGKSWIEEKGGTYSFVQRNGVTKLLLDKVAFSEDYKYSVTFYEELTPEYEAHLKEVQGAQEYETNPVYGWYPVSMKKFKEPVFTNAEITAARSDHSDPWFIHNIICELSLNDAANAHKWFVENSINDKIYYNQWVTLPTSAKSHSAVAAAPAAETQTVRTTNFNVVPDGILNEMAERYDNNNSTHISQYTETFTGLPQNEDYNFTETTRAYIPVVPSGFEGKVAPTYIVAEDTKTEPLNFASMILTGIEAVEEDEDTPAEYYTIQGIRVAVPSVPGFYIVRQGSKISKVYIR